LRRLFGVVLFVSSLALMAAVPTPAPMPTPAPVLAPTPPPALAQNPTVLIYPFDAANGSDAKIGSAVAQIYAQTMSGAGGLTVLTIPTNVSRPQFLDYARSQHADYYISGYVTPVGDGAAVVSQVVSVDSGVILFSQTAQVGSVADVASQSLQARAQIMAISGRGTQDINAQSSNTPAPTASNGASMQLKGISGIVDSVFGKHHGNGPTPAPAPIAKPPRGVIVAPVTASGALPAPDAGSATNELYFAMQHFYNVTLTNTTQSVKKAADSICGTKRDNTIATGILEQIQEKHKKAQYQYTLQIYACFGDLLDSETGKGDTIKAAVDAAVAAYVKAHPDNS